MSLRHAGTVLAVLATTAGAGLSGLRAQGTPRAQEAQTEAADVTMRRVKSRVQAVYPDLARKLNLTGTVKVEVRISRDGTVKNARVVGGNPVLGNAALEAAKKWRFEPAGLETSGVVGFKFEPHP